MLKITVYEDDINYREALTKVLSKENEIQIRSYGDCLKIVENTTDNCPDVILMDIELPIINGIEAMNSIKIHFPSVKVIILTHFDDDDKIVNALIQGGADGYLLKNTVPDKIIEAIHDVIKGGSTMSPYIAKRVLQIFNENKIIVKPNTIVEICNLTATEKKVLEILTLGYSYKMIANELNISINTVKNHLKKVYQKLQVNSAPEAVSRAIKSKLV